MKGWLEEDWSPRLSLSSVCREQLSFHSPWPLEMLACTQVASTTPCSGAPLIAEPIPVCRGAKRTPDPLVSSCSFQTNTISRDIDPVVKFTGVGAATARWQTLELELGPGLGASGLVMPGILL